MIRARVTVLPKRAVLDPQGEAVFRSLQTLGHEEVQAVHVGRAIELELDADNEDEARRHIVRMCDELLVNPIIERYEIEMVHDREMVVS